ncbi:MAG: hypothetical protein LBL62_03345 [Planctomycetaceae bacterium]|nr:hypothetical protein [Planctomycetaceae bacterium]
MNQINDSQLPAGKQGTSRRSPTQPFSKRLPTYDYLLLTNIYPFESTFFYHF